MPTLRKGSDRVCMFFLSYKAQYATLEVPPRYGGIMDPTEVVKLENNFLLARSIDRNS